MRDRLKELIRQKSCFYVNCDGDCLKCTDKYSVLECDVERIADHLLANGIIVPPCKVGDMVYELHDYYSQAKGHHTAIVTHKVTELLYSSNRGVRPLVVCCWGGYRFDNCDFGKTVFLTKEEAEKALERSGE